MQSRAERRPKSARRMRPMVCNEARLFCVEAAPVPRKRELHRVFSDLDRVPSILAAAVLAAVLSLGLLAAVARLFSSEGVPLQHVLPAEHECQAYPWVSERESCIERLANAQGAGGLARAPDLTHR